MNKLRWCYCCDNATDFCKCTAEQLSRHYKEAELEAARHLVAKLEFELGLPATTSNRKQRRANSSKRRGVHAR